MFFIDCEFNGFGGELITMALVADDGNEFYADVETYDYYPCDFVRKHVLPVIDVPGAEATPIARTELPQAISNFLCQYGSVHLVADWPDDIKYFCEALMTGPGERVDTPPLAMEIVRIDGDSEVPHNALCDARGIRDAYQRACPDSVIIEELTKDDIVYK